jgi:hypothetical protein
MDDANSLNPATAGNDQRRGLHKPSEAINAD